MAHWYRGCAALPKSDEAGSNPACATKYKKNQKKLKKYLFFEKLFVYLHQTTNQLDF